MGTGQGRMACQRICPESVNWNRAKCNVKTFEDKIVPNPVPIQDLCELGHHCNQLTCLKRDNIIFVILPRPLGGAGLENKAASLCGLTAADGGDEGIWARSPPGEESIRLR